MHNYIKIRATSNKYNESQFNKHAIFIYNMMAATIISAFGVISLLLVLFINVQKNSLNDLSSGLKLNFFQNLEKSSEQALINSLEPIIIKNLYPVCKGKNCSFSDPFKHLNEQCEYRLNESRNSKALISYKLLVLMVIVAGFLGYAIGRLKICIYSYSCLSPSSSGESISPDFEAEEFTDASSDLVSLETLSYSFNQIEKEIQSMVDNTNFERNFYDHEILEIKGCDTTYTAVHGLDKQTYMIKKIPLYITNKKNFFDYQIMKDLSNLKKLNSKYIARYITSWLEDTQLPKKFSEANNKVIIVCIQLEIYTDRVLKDWLGSGIDNKKPCFKIFKQLVKAVKHIHEKGISHGNLKSKNIYLDRSRNIKITNFRLGKLAKEDFEAGKAKDILDLAVMLFELFSKFESKEQRKYSIRQLRDDHIISEEFKKNFDEVYEIIELMINQNYTHGVIDRVLKHQIINNAI